MAISFVASAHSDTKTGSLPSGTQAGDVLIAIVQDESIPSGPSGWTKLGQDRTSTEYTASVWYIVRGSSTPALTWGGSSVAPAIDILAYREATAPEAWAQSSAGSSVAPSVTTTVPDSVLVCLYADIGTGSGPPTGMTNRTPTSSSQYNTVADEVRSTPGATGTRSFTNTDIPIGAWSVVLAPMFTTEEGGSEASVSISASGGGKPGYNGGSEASISISAAGDGEQGYSGGSQASVDASSEGLGQAGFFDGSEARTVVISDGSGSPAVSGGSFGDLTLLDSGSGTPGLAGGSSTGISAASESGGIPNPASGADASISISAFGHGKAPDRGGSVSLISITSSGGWNPAVSGGSTAALLAVASGTGARSAFGGSVAPVPISVAGDGGAGFSDGATPKMTVLSTGDGRRSRVDIYVEVRPTRTSHSLGPSIVDRGA